MEDNLFMESDYKIKDITQFCQFIVNNKLITLIGEIHNYENICDNPTGIQNNKDSIIEYIDKRKNEDVNILLEYFDKVKMKNKLENLDINNLHSSVLNKIYNLNIDKNKLQGWDIRRKYLDYKDQNYLYDDNEFKININELEEKYLLPLKLFIEENKSLNCFPDNYYDNITKKIKTIRNKKHFLQKIWNQISDCYALELINKIKCPEIILIAGDLHIENISKILENKGYKNILYKKSAYKKCIHVYYPISIDEILKIS